MRQAGPSLTARWVAAQRAGLHEKRPSSPDGDLDGERRLYRGFSRGFLLPGLAPTAMAARTSFFDREVVAAIDCGIDQIVIVGAGYDGRAWRFRSPGVHWIEVDHPLTQSDKRGRLASLGLDLDHVSFVAVDLLVDDLEEALEGAGHSDGRPTLFICEGLFAYLPTEMVVAVGAALADRAAAGSVLAANFLVVPDRSRFVALLQRGVDTVLTVIGERRLATFRPGDPERLLTAAGWTETRRSPSRSDDRSDSRTRLLMLAAAPYHPT